MRIATWNVNSIRTRIDRVIAFLERSNVDVLAMQEIKCKPEQFPTAAFEAAGYSVVAHGLNQWNGVAVASRLPIDHVTTSFPNQPAFGDPAVVEARALGATIRLPSSPEQPALSNSAAPGFPTDATTVPTAAPGLPVSALPSATASASTMTVWSLYVPNGREIDHPHYAYKLAWLAELKRQARAWLDADPEALIAMVGDWNVAPTDEDVWDIAAFEGATHVSAPERQAFAAFAEDGWTEVTRGRADNYTYWDYQKLRFPKNEGMRIDFIQASPALSRHVRTAEIDRDERKGKGASDHVPVIIDLRF
ncbi:exodeoxyribonuclease III [Schaalia suimastitidis]|uniref:exodeoxyribonuclease III n=1 Tax=Schaalia suimastitidis TaxID=121163 RepID=UPI00040D6012|nr:exodeoxyribonuclease III [Schaalia suimastitidis]